MSLRERISAWTKGIREKYLDIKRVGYKLAGDFRELFQYGACSFDKLIYQSVGVAGICNDFIVYKNTLPDRLSNIREDFRTLEKIVSKNYSADTENKTHSPNYLSTVIDLKNKYFWKDYEQLRDVVQKETKIKVDNIESLLTEAMSLKVDNPLYKDISRINYDSRISPKNMKDEIIRSYAQSDKTLKELSKELELRYGMHISSSTISVNARKYLSSQGLEFENRREAKKYYSTIPL